MVDKVGNLSRFNHQLAVLDFVGILKQAARRRSGGARAVLVIHAAVTGAHEQSRLREPAHRASQVSAVDGEDLKLLARAGGAPSRECCRSRRPETLEIGFLNFASRVWPSGNSSSSPSVIQR